jgi:hypothetical protein
MNWRFDAMLATNRENRALLADDLLGLRRHVRLSLLAAKHILQTSLLRRPHVPLESIADQTWRIAPAETIFTRPAFFLPGQLERVTGTAYTDDPRREMAGGIELPQASARGFLVKDAWLIDGAIYKHHSSHWLHARSSRIPPLYVKNEIDRGAVYSTFEGNKFFGLWLTDDCATYPLAASEGTPITTNRRVSSHMLAYEDWFEMKPIPLQGAFLREVVFFFDFCQTRHKRERFRTLGNKLLSHVKVQDHPGVFILRGGTGKRRLLHNELELAEHLRTRRGFRIVDVTTDDVPTIVAACAGARVVVGVEGSHLIHGIMVLQPGGAVLTLQPSNRFCGVIKRTTDPDSQDFGFVVGHADAAGFRIDVEELERTLDLLVRRRDPAGPIHRDRA